MYVCVCVYGLVVGSGTQGFKCLITEPPPQLFFILRQGLTELLRMALKLYPPASASKFAVITGMSPHALSIKIHFIEINNINSVHICEEGLEEDDELEIDPHLSFWIF